MAYPTIQRTHILARKCMHMSVCCDALYRKKWCLHFIISQVDFNYKRLFIALNANLTHNFDRLLAQFILSKWASMLNVANIPATRVSVFPRFRNGFYCDLKGAEKALEQAMNFSSQRIMIIEQLRLSIICTEWRKNEAIKRAMWFLCSMLLSDAHFFLLLHPDHDLWNFWLRAALNWHSIYSTRAIIENL